MRRTGLSWLAAGVLVVASASCFKDPVTSLQSSNATRLILTSTTPSGPIGTLSNITVTARPDTNVISIQALDNQGNYIAFGAPTFTTADPTVATVVAFPDSTIGHVPGSTLWKALVIAGTTFGITNVTVTAAGVTDTINVVTLPVNFTGTVSKAAANSGDTITINAPALLSFGPNANATFSPGPAFRASVTPTALKMVMTGAGPATTFTVSGVVMSGVPLPTLTSTATVSVTDALEPANNTAAGAVNMGVIKKAGDSLVVGSSISFTDAGSDATGNGADYWSLTLDTTTTLSLNLSFNGSGNGGTDQNPDLDVVICTNSTCTYNTDLAGNKASATNNPEAGTTTAAIVGSAGAPTTVYIRVYGYFSTTAGVTGYRLRVKAP